MPNIDLTTTSTFSDVLSAFGPNKTGIYTNLILKTVQSPVTAFVTAMTFNNAISTTHAEGTLFTFSPSGLNTFPSVVTSTGRNMALSAVAKEGCKGTHTATLALTVSSQCLSGAGNGVSTAVSNPSQVISFPVTFVNKKYHGDIDRRERHRRRYLGFAN